MTIMFFFKVSIFVFAKAMDKCFLPFITVALACFGQYVGASRPVCGLPCEGPSECISSCPICSIDSRICVSDTRCGLFCEGDTDCMFSNSSACTLCIHHRCQAESDAVAMQLFVSSFSANCTDPSWTPSTPVCSWDGVVCNSSTGRVVQFNANSRGCSGLVRLSLLPSEMQYVALDYNEFSGKVDLTRLPSALQNLGLSNNGFSGTLDLTQLPSAMQFLGLDFNDLSGTVDLTRLPSALQSLWLYNNGFSGTVDLTQLPSAMQILELYNNSFSGTVDLTELPSAIQYLYLHQNQFSGTLDLTQLPSQLLGLELYNNQFSGTLNLTQLPSGMGQLGLSGNSFCGETMSDIGCSPLVLPSSCNCASANGKPSVVTCPAC